MPERTSSSGLPRARHGTARRRALLCCAAALGLATTGCEPDTSVAAPLEVDRVLGERGTFPGQFAYPRGLDFAGGSLWVVDKEARVQQIDPETGLCGYWWRTPEHEMGKPTGVTVAPATYPDGSVADAVYLADTHYHRVLVYAHPGEMPARPTELAAEPIASFGEIGTGPGQFIYPTDIAVLTSADGAIERIYVSEYGGNDRISVFDSSHEFLFSFGTKGEGLDPSRVEFSRPQSLAIDTQRRELIVADACNHRLGRFTLDGELIAWIGSPVPADDARVVFDFPYSAHLLGDGSVLVTEFGGARMQRIDPVAGEGLGVFGVAGRGEGEVATPWCAVVGGRVTYVLDSGNNRILATKLPGVIGSPGGQP